MKATYACANGVQGEAKIDNFSPKGRVRGDMYLTAVVPARVRFDVVSFGTTLYTLTSDGDKFHMLDVKEKQFLYGPASACNLARLTQVPIPGAALVSLPAARRPCSCTSRATRPSPGIRAASTRSPSPAPARPRRRSGSRSAPKTATSPGASSGCA